MRGGGDGGLWFPLLSESSSFVSDRGRVGRSAGREALTSASICRSNARSLSPAVTPAPASRARGVRGSPLSNSRSIKGGDERPTVVEPPTPLSCVEDNIEEEERAEPEVSEGVWRRCFDDKVDVRWFIGVTEATWRVQRESRDVVRAVERRTKHSKRVLALVPHGWSVGESPLPTVGELSRLGRLAEGYY